MRFWLPALVAIAVLPASAHHPFTPYYDGSKLASISGPIVELRSINPHVVLIIEGTGPDGRMRCDHSTRWGETSSNMAPEKPSVRARKKWDQ